MYRILGNFHAIKKIVIRKIDTKKYSQAQEIYENYLLSNINFCQNFVIYQAALSE